MGTVSNQKPNSNMDSSSSSDEDVCTPRTPTPEDMEAPPSPGLVAYARVDPEPVQPEPEKKPLRSKAAARRMVAKARNPRLAAFRSNKWVRNAIAIDQKNPGECYLIHSVSGKEFSGWAIVKNEDFEQEQGEFIIGIKKSTFGLISNTAGYKTVEKQELKRFQYLESGQQYIAEDFLAPYTNFLLFHVDRTPPEGMEDEAEEAGEGEDPEEVKSGKREAESSQPTVSSIFRAQKKIGEYIQIIPEEAPKYSPLNMLSMTHDQLLAVQSSVGIEDLDWNTLEVNSMGALRGRKRRRV